MCAVNIECMAGPFNQHFRFPLRFSASADDWIYGMQHDSMYCPKTGLRRRWLDFAALLPALLCVPVLAMISNPMYDTQLAYAALLKQAQELMVDATDSEVAY